MNGKIISIDGCHCQIDAHLKLEDLRGKTYFRNYSDKGAIECCNKINFHIKTGSIIEFLIVIPTEFINTPHIKLYKCEVYEYTVNGDNLFLSIKFLPEDIEEDNIKDAIILLEKHGYNVEKKI